MMARKSRRGSEAPGGSRYSIQSSSRSPIINRKMCSTLVGNLRTRRRAPSPKLLRASWSLLVLVDREAVIDRKRLSETEETSGDPASGGTMMRGLINDGRKARGGLEGSMIEGGRSFFFSWSPSLASKQAQRARPYGFAAGCCVFCFASSCFSSASTDRTRLMDLT
jgi:hypothetical protein